MNKATVREKEVNNHKRICINVTELNKKNRWYDQ